MAGFVLGGDFAFVCQQPSPAVACVSNSLSVNSVVVDRNYGVIADSRNGQTITQIVIVSHTRDYFNLEIGAAIHEELGALYNYFSAIYGPPLFVNQINHNFNLENYNFPVMQWYSNQSEAIVFVTYNPLTQSHRVMAVLRNL